MAGTADTHYEARIGVGCAVASRYEVVSLQYLVGAMAEISENTRAIADNHNLAH